MDEIRDLYENAPCGYHSIDADWKFVRINNTELKWLGYTRDELIGKRGFADLLTPASSETFKSSFPVFMKQGELSNLEFEMTRKDGSTFFVSLNATAIYDADGKFLKSRSTLFDITDRKLFEEALSKTKREAEEANKAKSEFLANMSHEIRTPMNAVLGYTELLSSMLVDQTQKDYINSIKSSGRSLLTLINDILDLSKIEAGKLEMEYEYVDTYSFFSEFERIFSLKVSEKGLKFILDITSGTPAGINIDEARVRQIVFNLIGNAIKFTSEGKIVLKVFTENPQIVNYSKEKSEELIDLIIEVQDTGIGISTELQEAIFEPFVQERDNKHRGGTGLGLTITRRLTALMDGTIHVQSKPGKGSIFTVRIPEIAYLRDFSKTTVDIQIDPSEIVFEEASILIADDVEHNRSYLRDALKNTRLKIVEAEDGITAYKLAKEIAPDLIIADILMPKMDGFQLLDKIKTDKKLKHIPVIAYSASVLKGQKERIHNSEFAGLLIKPVKVAELYLELMNFLPFKSTRKAEPDKPLSEVDLIGEINDMPGLIHYLETDFYTTWKTFAVRQPIGEIRDFGKSLIQLGMDHNSSIITGYGKELISAADSFNIEVILILIEKYKGIIENLKKVS
jgi:two-component system sensor histidine kinase EvgS